MEPGHLVSGVLAQPAWGDPPRKVLGHLVTRKMFNKVKERLPNWLMWVLDQGNALPAMEEEPLRRRGGSAEHSFAGWTKSHKLKECNDCLFVWAWRGCPSEGGGTTEGTEPYEHPNTLYFQ